jgi:asparagine synthase (glutamine-hydrolysing)
MANSLEGRAPYLTPRLAGLALRGADPYTRMTLTDSKRALRRVARRWLPQDILERPKQGFVLPMRQWLKQWFDAHHGARAYFDARPLPDVDPAELVDVVERDLAEGLQRERLLFALVMLSEWRAASSSRIAAARVQLRNSPAEQTPHAAVSA